MKLSQRLLVAASLALWVGFALVTISLVISLSVNHVAKDLVDINRYDTAHHLKGATSAAAASDVSTGRTLSALAFASLMGCWAFVLPGLFMAVAATRLRTREARSQADVGEQAQRLLEGLSQLSARSEEAARTVGDAEKKLKQLEHLASLNRDQAEAIRDALAEPIVVARKRDRALAIGLAGAGLMGAFATTWAATPKH